MQPKDLTRPHIHSVTRTLRLKVKTESYAWLNTAAYEVNQVWNWAAEVGEKAARLFKSSTIDIPAAPIPTVTP
jgi:hypothetical protein